MFLMLFASGCKAGRNGEYESKSIEFFKGSEGIILDCMVKGRSVLVPAEPLLDFYGIRYEVCSRCGNLCVYLEDGSGDIILIEWNSPYVDYQNREGRITLKENNVYKDGFTYCSRALLEKIITAQPLSD